MNTLVGIYLNSLSIKFDINETTCQATATETIVLSSLMGFA